MQDDKLKVLNYAMHYGVALGFFWAFKYIFLIGSTYYPSLSFVYVVLNIGTFFLMYYLTARYRDRANGGKISYSHCVLFTVLLCFFASLIEAVVTYFHYTVIDPTYISSVVKESIGLMKNKLEFPKEFISQAEHMSFSPLFYTISQIISDVILGFIVSLVYGFIITKNDKFE